MDEIVYKPSLAVSIKNREWHKIAEYLQEARISDFNNSYALHQICSNPRAPLQVVKMIFHAYPKAGLVQNNSQDTPIAIAVRALFENAVHFLANACPMSIAIGDLDGCTPMLSAISLNERNNMIDSMINANPAAAFIVDDEDESAFDGFFTYWNVFIRIILHTNDIITHELLDDYIGYGDWKIRDICEKAHLFLKAASLYRSGKALDDNYLLHCALKEECCHCAFCSLFMKLHPEQVFRRDLDGKLPIHIITASRNLSDENTLLCFDCFTNKTKLINVDYHNGSTKYCCEECLEYEPKNLIKDSFNITPVYKVDEAVKVMLTMAPQMVLIPDLKQNYPLHIAIRHRQNYHVIHVLHKAIPDTGRYVMLKQSCCLSC